MSASKPVGILRAFFPPPTATGAPRTMLGYYLGQIACRVGRHRLFTLTQWAYGPRGDRVTEWCERDRCDWSLGWWTREGRPTTRRRLLCRIGWHSLTVFVRLIPSFAEPGEMDRRAAFTCRRQGCSYVMTADL
jgi:hypothetical protein